MVLRHLRGRRSQADTARPDARQTAGRHPADAAQASPEPAAPLSLKFPHCDQRVLHAPGECEFCDLHPDWQALRTGWGIAFTGRQPAGQLPRCGFPIIRHGVPEGLCQLRRGHDGDCLPLPELEQTPCPADASRPDSAHQEWQRNRPAQPPAPADRPGLTTDRDDPRLTHGPDTEPGGQAEVYLVLSEEDRARGYIRPVRRTYRHAGPPGPQHPLRDLTAEEHERYDTFGYVKYETYPEGQGTSTGRYWTQARLDKAGKGCGAVTTMSAAIAETYATEPGFYGSTFCVACSMHLPVGQDGEFVWDGTNQRVGT